MKPILKHSGWFFLVFLFFISMQSAHAGQLITHVSMGGGEPVNMKMDKMSTAAASFPISWSLTEPGKVTLFICDVAGNIVRTLIDREDRPAGGDSTVWDGLDDDGDACPGDIYFPVIKLKSHTKGVERYNPTAEPWGLEVVKGKAEYDKYAGVIRFETIQKALCRIHVGEADGGPLYKTVLQWQVLEPGLHEIPWDGMDETGVVDVATKSTMKIVIDAFSLPPNSIVTLKENPQEKEQKHYKQHPIHKPHGGTNTYFPLLPAGLVHDFAITANLSDKVDTVDGIPQVTGKYHLVVSSKQDAIILNQRYKEVIETYLFVDGQLLFETSFEKMPIKILLDTTQFDNGLHIVTVNLRTSLERSGTFSMPININN